MPVISATQEAEAGGLSWGEEQTDLHHELQPGQESKTVKNKRKECAFIKFYLSNHNIDVLQPGILAKEPGMGLKALGNEKSKVGS